MGRNQKVSLLKLRASPVVAIKAATTVTTQMQSFLVDIMVLFGVFGRVWSDRRVFDAATWVWDCVDF